ncbi:MAG: helix-turn-helix domain-containing protein [Pyrinomonadaceae bacterium]
MLNRALIEDFGKRIRQLRTERNLSQEKLAELTGFHRTYIGMVERGERNISLSNIAVFAATFEISVSELFNFDGKRGGR